MAKGSYQAKDWLSELSVALNVNLDLKSFQIIGEKRSGFEKTTNFGFLV